MGALPKRRISTARQGRRRQDKAVPTSRGTYVSSRDRRAAKKEAAK